MICSSSAGLTPGSAHFYPTPPRRSCPVCQPETSAVTPTGACELHTHTHTHANTSYAEAALRFGLFHSVKSFSQSFDVMSTDTQANVYVDFIKVFLSQNSTSGWTHTHTHTHTQKRTHKHTGSVVNAQLCCSVFRVCGRLSEQLWLADQQLWTFLRSHHSHWPADAQPQLQCGTNTHTHTHTHTHMQCVQVHVLTFHCVCAVGHSGSAELEAVSGGVQLSWIPVQRCCGQ